MRSVAYVTTTFPTLAAFIEGEVHRLRQRGVRVRVFTLRRVGRDYQPEHQALVPLTRAVGSPLDPRGWGALMAWFLRRPRVLVPDVLRLLWASRGSLYALAGHLAYLPAAARVASLVRAEDLEWVHGAWAHFPATVAYLAARLTGRPFSMAAHAGADLYRTRAFLAHKARHARFVAACVRGNAEMLRRLAGPTARVEWIYHGADLRRFDGRGRAPDPEPLLLAVGRLASPKGFDDAIRALAVLRARGRGARLVIAGDGPRRAALESLARAEGVDDRVEFRGALTHQELVPLYRRAWALVAPSKVLPNGRRDGIPNVVVEAMAMGVPCVGSRAVGLEEAIVPGETGALCEPGAPGSLAAALEPLLGDPASLERLGARARARAVERFDAERNFERLLSLWEAAAVREPAEVAAPAAADGRPRRVMHVIEAMHQGGAESLVLEHVRHAGPGVEVTVCAVNRGGPALEEAERLGARVFVLRPPGRRGLHTRLSAVRALARRMREQQVGVVNGHNPSGALHAALAARLAGVPVVVRTEHSVHYPGRYGALYPLLEPLLTALAARVVCVCDAVRESHARRFGWAARKFVTVSNGIGPAPATRPRPTVRAGLGLAPADLALLTVGSLTRQKAQHLLLEAFARIASSVPESRLLIVGEGPRRGALEARARALGIAGRVHWLGARADVAELMEAADLFVLSSEREGLSVTLLEAMRAGRAAVVTRAGGSGEALADGETGLLVPVGDPAALAAALESLLRDPARRARMGAVARERWAERFTAARMVAETEALYGLERRAAAATATPDRLEERHATA